MDTSVNAFQLKAGYHLIATQDDTAWLLYAPGDQWISLNADPQKIAQLKKILSTPYKDGSQQQQAIAQAELHQEFEEFRSFGLLEISASDQTHTQAEATLSIQLIGSSDFCNTLKHLLSGFTNKKISHAPCPSGQTNGGRSELMHFATPQAWYEHQAQAGVASEPSTKYQLVMHIDTWQNIEQSIALENHCREHKLSYLGAYHEGHQLLIGPLIRPDSLISLRDVQGRRLASADYPQAFLQYQQQVANADASQVKAPTMAAHAHSRAADIVMHFLADFMQSLLPDIAANQTPLTLNQQTRRDGCQWSIDIHTAATQQHQILPLPAAPAT